MKWVAHRGLSSQAPENTLAAFWLALKTPGIDAIELDVHFSKDRQVVVTHDRFLGRTVLGTGQIDAYTYPELGDKSAGAWFDKAFEAERVPLLSQVLDLVGSKKPLLIETKQEQGGHRGLEQAVAELLREAGLLASAWVMSFDHTAILRLHKENPRVRTGLVVQEPLRLDIKKRIERTGASLVTLDHRHLNAQAAFEIQSSGAVLGVWTVDEPADARRVLSIAADAWITSNAPDKLRDALRGEAFTTISS